MNRMFDPLARFVALLGQMRRLLPPLTAKQRQARARRAEIAAHNNEVERKKREKREAKALQKAA